MRLPKSAARLRGRNVRLMLAPSSREDPVVFDLTVGNDIRCSLRTSDKELAAKRVADLRAQLEAYFTVAAAEPVALTHRQKWALAGVVYQTFWKAHEENPGLPGDWAAWKALSRAASEGRLADVPEADLDKSFDEVAMAAQRFGRDLTAGVNALPAGDPAEGLERRFGAICDLVLARQGLAIHDDDRRDLLAAIAEGAHDAAWRLKRAAQGDYTPDPKAERFPKFEREPRLTFQGLFDRWAAETKPSGSTLASWKSPLASFRAHVKHDDAKRATEADAIGWKNQLVTSGLAPKTIRDGHLAALRTIWSYGLKNKLVTANPFSGVKIAVRKRAGTGKLPYSAQEVGRLLHVARGETDAYRRWLVWLAAYTGCRIGEAAQAWGDQFETIDEIHVWHIRPAQDAGSLKNEWSERTVPLHSALVAEGFLEFVKGKGKGPLFYGRSRGKPGSRHASKGVTNRLAKWIRDQDGFDDPRKAPAHALRHAFKTIGFEAGLQDSLVDHLQGHAIASTAGVYRHFSLPTLRDAIERIQIKVDQT